jgi:hypothetical protein
VIAGLIAFDILFIGAGDGVARLVHLGGAGIGYLADQSPYAGDTTFPNMFVRLNVSGQNLPKSKKKKNRPRNKKMYSVSDVEIVEETDQSELDQILEKISKEGYDGLTAEEKRKLFELSKRN